MLPNTHRKERPATKWNPATSNGKPVVILVKMPIVFNLN
jgi:hypothetical protein